MKDLSPWHIRRVGSIEETEPQYIYPETEQAHLSDYWKILVKRRKLMLLVFLAIFGVGAFFTFSATTLYTASATVKIEPQNPQVTGVGMLQPVDAGGGPYDYYQTQFALLKSRPLAARVITDLRLESNNTFSSADIITANPLNRVKSWILNMLGYVSDFVAPLFRSDPKQEDFQPIKVGTKVAQEEVELRVPSWLIGRYMGLLRVDPVKTTRLVKVAFTTPDPALSQALANAHVQGFLRMSLENRFSLTKEAREFLDQKKGELSEKLRSSEEVLNNFRRTHGVVSVEKGENIVVDRLIDLNKQLTGARTQRIEAESLYRTVENRNYQDLSQVMTQGLVQQLKSNIASLEAERARLSTIFKPDHPRIQELGQQIAEAQRGLNAEIAKVVRSIRSNYAAARAREDALEAEANRQQERALRLKEVGVQYTVLQEEVKANQALFENVLRRLSETNVSNDIAVSNMQITERAEKPNSPSFPNPPLYLLATISLGLLFAVGAALFADYMDSTVTTPEDVWKTVGLSTLGVVPDLKFLSRRIYGGGKLEQPSPRREDSAHPSRTRSTSKELITSQNPLSILSESYRAIRTSLLLSQPEKPPQVVLVTSPAPGEGKTVTTLNLAIALAHDGQSVLVIDGDMRKGSCHSRLGLRNNKGLSNVLTGNLSLEKGLQKTSVAGLTLLSRGVLPPNPAELLGSRRMKKLLEELRQTFNFILIDVPPVIAVSDAAVASVLGDGVILVLNGQKTMASSARSAVERLEMVRARILGVVLNSVNLDNPDYAYYRSYSSYYGSPNDETPDEEERDEKIRNLDKVIHVTEVADREEEWSIGEQGHSEEGDSLHDTQKSGDRDSTINKEAAYNRETIEAEAEAEDSHASQSEVDEEILSEKEKTDEVVPQQFLEKMTDALCEVVGPIAPLIIRDQISTLGELPDAFPQRKLRELLRLVDREILNDRLRAKFQQRISAELQNHHMV